MRELTVKQLAAVSGVTVRTLHHYDKVGLLKPASVGGNGYRYYGRKQLLRLQRILLHRELNAPLHVIADLLNLEGENWIGALRQHREKMKMEQARHGTIIDTIDRTISELQGKRIVAKEDLFRGFSPKKPATDGAWWIELYGWPILAAEVLELTHSGVTPPMQ